DPFVYPGGITVDLDGSILVTDTGIRLNSIQCQKDAQGNTIVTTCDHDPGKIIRINKGTGDGVYASNTVVAKAGLLFEPFEIALYGSNDDMKSNIYVTDMNAKLGNTDSTKGPTDPGAGG